MSHKKSYAAPAVMAEGVLEQTSLACNVTVEPSLAGTPGYEGTYVDTASCTVNSAKGGVFADAVLCEIEGKDFVTLS